MNFKPLIFNFLILSLGMSSFALAQNVPVIYAECQPGNVGTQACIIYKVKNFVDVEGLQFNVSYNPNELTPVNPTFPADVSFSALPNLFPGDMSCIGSTGLCGLVWFNGPESMPDDSELFRMCFNLIGEPGQCAEVTMHGNNVDGGIDVITTTGSNIPIVVNCCIPITTSQLTIVSGYCEPTSSTNTDGTIHFYPTGGGQPYSYTVFLPGGGTLTDTNILDGQEVIIPGLGSGMYSISITDNSGASVIKNITLTDNLAITFDIKGKNPSCSYLDNGYAVISNIQGGILPYEISWSNFTYNTDSIPDLVNGTYSVTVEDRNGCEVSNSVTLNLDTLSVSAVVLDSAECKGSATGQIRITASGGSPFNDGYSLYLKKPQDNFIIPITGHILDYTNNTIQPGIVKFFISDNATPSRCFTDTVELYMPFKNTILFNASVDNIKCKDDGKGVINISPYNIGNDYSIRLYDASTNLIVLNASSNKVNLYDSMLVVGNYFVTAKSNPLGCLDTFRFSIIEPQIPFAVDTNIIYPSCTIQDGTIELIASGGISPYTYTWSDIGVGPSKRTNLAAGLYLITISDANLCEKYYSITMNAGGGQLNVRADVLQAIRCRDGKDGSVIANTTEPGTIMYSWSDGTNNIGNTQIIPNLGFGTYYVTVTANGCSADTFVYLSNPEAIQFQTVNITPPECKNGGFKGLLGVTAKGGFAPFFYEWTNTTAPATILSTLPLLPSVMSGNYKVVVKDLNGCTKDTVLILPEGVSINVNLSNVAPVKCFNEINGSARATASSSNPATTTFTFLWSSSPRDGGSGAFNVADSLASGQNWVIASDLKCSSDTIFFNTQNATQILPNAVVVSPGCLGQCTGSITVTPSGGGGAPYSTSWAGGITPINLCPGSYYLTLVDSKACSVKDTFTLTSGEPILVSKDPQASFPITCRVNRAQIGLSINGGIGTYTFQWLPNVSASKIASDLTPGIYSVTVSDSNGCTANFRDTISGVNPVIAVVANPIPPNCFGEKTCIRIGQVSGGVPGMYTFQINQGFNVPIDSCLEVFAGTYLVNVFDAVGCKFDTTVVINQPDPVEVDLGPDITINLGDSIDVISPTVSSSINITNYLWSEFSPLKCVDEECTELTGKPLEDMTIRLAVVDENGCAGVDQLSITVEKVREVFIPNIFNPNAGNENKAFNIYIGPGVREVTELRIFDRWGNVMYTRSNYIPETLNPDDGWNGTQNGVPLIPGVYMYYCKVSFIDGRVLNYTGDVTLVR